MSAWSSCTAEKKKKTQKKNRHVCRPAPSRPLQPLLVALPRFSTGFRWSSLASPSAGPVERASRARGTALRFISIWRRPRDCAVKASLPPHSFIRPRIPGVGFNRTVRHRRFSFPGTSSSVMHSRSSISLAPPRPGPSARGDQPSALRLHKDYDGRKSAGPCPLSLRTKRELRAAVESSSKLPRKFRVSGRKSRMSRRDPGLRRMTAGRAVKPPSWLLLRSLASFLSLSR